MTQIWPRFGVLETFQSWSIKNCMGSCLNTTLQNGRCKGRSGQPRITINPWMHAATSVGVCVADRWLHSSPVSVRRRLIVCILWANHLRRWVSICSPVKAPFCVLTDFFCSPDHFQFSFTVIYWHIIVESKEPQLLIYQTLGNVSHSVWVGETSTHIVRNWF